MTDCSYSSADALHRRQVTDSMRSEEFPVDAERVVRYDE
jgi:hypothetical protein